MPTEVMFTDAHGLTWTVYEVPASRIEFGDRVVERSLSHLTFETVVSSRTIVKRLDDYPADWPRLREAELEDLCLRAGPTPRLGGPAESEATRRSIDQAGT